MDSAKCQQMDKGILRQKKIDFSFPFIDKEMLKPIIKELQNYKGLVLVDVKAQDGTEVKIRL